MHKTAKEAAGFMDQFIPLVERPSSRIFFAVPFTALHAVKHAPFTIGAQNMHDAIDGPFTGEVSAEMLKAEGAHFVILGHSERRQHFHESNAFIHSKLKRALAAGLTPLLCVGETLEEREKGHTESVLAKQLKECLANLSQKDGLKVILAYEPVWAIGTGKAATPEMAEEVHRYCRTFLSHQFGKEADFIPLLYGGSVKQATLGALLEQPNINGVLVGGASLDPLEFAHIVNYR